MALPSPPKTKWYLSRGWNPGLLGIASSESDDDVIGGGKSGKPGTTFFTIQVDGIVWPVDNRTGQLPGLTLVTAAIERAVISPNVAGGL